MGVVLQLSGVSRSRALCCCCSEFYNANHQQLNDRVTPVLQYECCNCSAPVHQRQQADLKALVIPDTKLQTALA